MSRRTVDITVDAYDAPMLAALAKRRDHQRALGHTDDERMPFFGSAWSLVRDTGFQRYEATAARIKRVRTTQEHEAYVDADVVLMGEVAEALEAKTDAARVYELLDVAAVCMRIASKMQRDLDSRGST